jgi:hypothetical protein
MLHERAASYAASSDVHGQRPLPPLANRGFIAKNVDRRPVVVLAILRVGDNPVRGALDASPNAVSG